MEGHGHRDNTSHYGPPEAGCAHTGPKEPGAGWDSPLQVSALVLFSVCEEVWWHLANPRRTFGCHQISYILQCQRGVGWLCLGLWHVGWGQYMKNIRDVAGVEGWLLDPELERKR